MEIIIVFKMTAISGSSIKNVLIIIKIPMLDYMQLSSGAEIHLHGLDMRDVRLNQLYKHLSLL